MTQTLHGIVHGNSIELSGTTTLADGAEVEVIIRPSRPDRRPADSFLRTEGALADDTAWDAIMEEVQQARRLERPLSGE